MWEAGPRIGRGDFTISCAEIRQANRLVGGARPNPLSSAMTSSAKASGSAITSSQAAEITGLYRYPIKGLTPEALSRVPLRVGQTLPADRRYAIENGPSGF